ncbi:ATP-binding cassette domain-containing protein [Wohlfahrtiimonas chitiniclastica]|uniref:ATP-binding cassette domain-containing protein n=1 Tax=Wohlfahrtiimonas chitiniclastica TaxID=400946 RepID=UPI0007B40AA5|nr:ATP-binding cassette domain-containing protein [Wohlfahrtiimonas chitiniclastica]KZS22948.1 ABC transporter ATP-binding protein [Wohlfahrtiimonas chitiniclastica]WHR55388.1 ATP-binding cassette domain-containing protein [Wohlfahrtiimonas chitiniclastica]
MAILTLHNISLAYGDRPLLQNLDFALEKGDRVALIGRNGEGKSSLLKVITGDAVPDDGEVIIDRGYRIAALSQEIPRDLTQTVYDVVAEGIPEVGQKLVAYHQLLLQPEDQMDLAELSRLQHEIEALDGWSLDQKVMTIISQLSLPKDEIIANLSGGWIRRVLLGKALVCEPDLLLLDEPTNHLDIDAILWLEEMLLKNYHGALLFITHDRQFLGKIANKIIELDRGILSEFPGSYDNYQRRKAEMLHAENQERALFDKRLAEEEVWIRKGIEARRTRNEGRVRALKAMREQFKERISRQGIAKLNFEEGSTSGKRVISAENISYSIDGKSIIKDFSMTLMRGDRVGLIGANGAGKSTLLKLLFEQLMPESGKVEVGTKLEIAYFDQLRSALDLEKSVMDNVAEGSDFIEINGKKQHLIGWLQDFMFTPEKARSPVKALSGGERNRLLLAKLFAKPANVIVLDEPTNDLDIETLEVLEELLLKFEGTLLIVSHDRAFIDKTVTSTLVFEGNGSVSQYVGGYSDWLESVESQKYFNHTAAQAENHKSEKKNVVEKKPETEAPKPQKVKLSYKETRELETLPALLEQLDQDIQALSEQTQHSDFYQQDHVKQAAVLDALARKNEELDEAFMRWELLEQKRSQM